MATATTRNEDAKTVGQALLAERDKTERAAEVIDRDPEQALERLEPVVRAGANVGEITPQDMFNLFRQLQEQQARMQEQMVALMTGGVATGPKAPSADTRKELERDRAQRDATLEAWRTEPREPVQLSPDQDEDKVYSVTGIYPPRVFRVNGLEFPINVGEIVMVPESIARLVQHTQRRRSMSGPPQGLPQFPDPQRGQFLAGAQSITVGGAGRSGEGRLIPDGLPPNPQPLGIRYDHNGQ